MKRKGNWGIYNRQLWGIVYREIIPELQYGMADMDRRLVYNETLAALGADKKRMIEL